MNKEESKNKNYLVIHVLFKHKNIHEQRVLN